MGQSLMDVWIAENSSQHDSEPLIEREWAGSQAGGDLVGH